MLNKVLQQYTRIYYFYSVGSRILYPKAVLNAICDLSKNNTLFSK